MWLNTKNMQMHTPNGNIVQKNQWSVSYTHLVKLITDRETRRSKGFAFVEMPDDAEANNVIKQLNGAESVSYTHLDVYKRQG